MLPPDLIGTGLSLSGLNLDFFLACNNVVYGIPDSIDALNIDSYVILIPLRFFLDNSTTS